MVHCPRRRRRKRRPSLSSGPDAMGWGQRGASCSVCDGGNHGGVLGALGPRHLTATSPCSDWWSRWWLGDPGKPGVSASSSSDAGECPFGASGEGQEEE